MQFFLLSAFGWMLIEVIDMYLMFIRVWNVVSHYILKASIIGWGFPTLVVVICIGVHFGSNEEIRAYPIYRETNV